jgi:hypothetical protein
MESSDQQPVVATLHNLEGRLLGSLVAPRPGPVIGRAAGTVYLVRMPRGSAARALRAERPGSSGRR